MSDAGAVQYTVTDFCEKNKDILAQDLVTLLQGSKSKFFSSMFEDAPAPANQKVMWNTQGYLSEHLLDMFISVSFVSFCTVLLVKGTGRI